MNLQSLRQQMRERRVGLTSQERKTAGQDLAHQLDLYLDQLSESILPHSLVCSFRSNEDLGEISTQGVDAHLRSRGYRVAYPRLAVDPEQSLDFRIAPSWDQTTAWEKDRFAIDVPAADCPVAELRDVALILMPGLAFAVDSGARIGYGKGHYDRWLAYFDGIRQSAHPVPRLGLGYAFQIVPGLTPQAWDKTIDAVITPEGWQQRRS